MTVYTGANTHAEERLVAELEQLGVRYLSRLTNEKARRVRTPHKLLADLVQQPSSRVRAALIARSCWLDLLTGSMSPVH